MFCNQCEQTTRGDVCHQWGACGKSPEVDALQDLLVHCLRGLSQVALQAKSLGIATRETDEFTCEMLFSTLTNVNFSVDDFINFVNRAIALRESLKLQIKATGNAVVESAIANFQPDSDTKQQIQQGKDLEFAFISQSAKNIDIFSLKLTVLYGLKGVAAYAFHACELDQHDEGLYTFCHEVLANLDAQDKTLEEWLALALKVGEINLKAMELLDAGNTTTFGHPTPTVVPLGSTVGKAILVSGHDLLALKAVLEQTVGTGIKVYTHGELLPAHGYPKLKQTYPHLYGHYGTAWQNQTHEFDHFPGAIVMTTNCLMPPHQSYQDKVFTLGPVGYPGLQHTSIRDISSIIAKAESMPGFESECDRGTVTTGFARNAVLSVADTVVNAVKDGSIRHFFLVGGCDGAKPGRNYYSELVEKLPDDCVVLTLGCGKFRFFDKDLGNIGGIPRLLDVGQCNDAYSAIQIAVALAQTFGVTVNQLPLSLVLSWYEQKAIAVLLSLLYLGIQNIRIGPTLPAFLTPNVVKILSEQFQLKLITSAEQDLAACLG
ncbi:hydroxylamine reductase [Calothrix sp. FACHB-1219]|uniref:hydroxylamine reductase n=1 Tax=unclassified Calothrix TaxID=2619626 RepID=UPI001683E673|nr:MULTISPECIES: hydroxylamine reductase [unclassified Calothrix]MBD2203481.1 hydroxylamine reductase [Calothrix sp. FACHB-168]MBD2219073.1 hydroxylamine reductase [Calothrix sp. FACHB-1219]